MILVSTSNGIFQLNPQSGDVNCILQPKQSLGFFGIVEDKVNNITYAASREKHGFSWGSKRSSDARLYSIDKKTLKIKDVALLRKVFDVHQIEIWKDIIFLSDTSKNRIHTFNLKTKSLSGIINIGKTRKDIHHMNALLVDSNNLLIGLNNRGYRDSEVLYFPLEKTPLSAGQKVDALQDARIETITGFQHTHDLEKVNGEIFLCASHQGKLVGIDDLKVHFSLDGFIRGIAGDKNGFWVGNSMRASREERHNSTLDGEVYLLDSKNFNVIKKYIIPDAGQVCDLISLS